MVRTFDERGERREERGEVREKRTTYLRVYMFLVEMVRTFVNWHTHMHSLQHLEHPLITHIRKLYANVNIFKYLNMFTYIYM